MRRLLPFVGSLLIGGGVFFVGWYLWAVIEPSGAPYEYRLVAQGGADEFPDLGLGPDNGLELRKYAIHVPGVDDTVAEFHVGLKDGGIPVLLDWRNRIQEPVFNFTTEVSETVKLTKAVSANVPSGALVLSWWDRSRRMRLLTGVNVLFDQHLGRPLFVPEPWRDAEEAIRLSEEEFWGVSGINRPGGEFDLFLDALLSDVSEGISTLGKLAGGKETYLVMHLSDAYRLGALRPEEFGVGFKDFPRTGNTHGMINNVKGWLHRQGYDSYTVERRGGRATRVYFLTNAESSRRLITQILPFSTSRPMEIEELQLVYQNQGYWVYRLNPAQKG